MSRFFLSAGTLLALAFLVGAGCTTTSPNTRTTPSDNTDQTESSGMTLTGQIMLQGVAIGAHQVTFEWDLDDSIAEPPLFILVRSEEKNPVMDGKTYWLRQHGTRRSVTWVNLPAGEQHFRICTSEDGNTCNIYSEDISLTVLSGPAPSDDTVMRDAEPGQDDSQDTADMKDGIAQETDEVKKAELEVELEAGMEERSN
jgi:hypothetical protein